MRNYRSSLDIWIFMTPSNWGWSSTVQRNLLMQSAWSPRVWIISCRQSGFFLDNLRNLWFFCESINLIICLRNISADQHELVGEGASSKSDSPFYHLLHWALLLGIQWDDSFLPFIFEGSFHHKVIIINVIFHRRRNSGWVYLIFDCNWCRWWSFGPIPESLQHSRESSCTFNCWHQHCWHQHQNTVFGIRTQWNTFFSIGLNWTQYSFSIRTQ